MEEDQACISGLWDMVAEAHYRLARKDFHPSISDLVVAETAAHYGKALFTLDQAFEHIPSAKTLTQHSL